MYKIGNLVVLSYASNECYTNVKKATKTKKNGLAIDPSKKTWSFNGETYYIGESRDCEYGCRWGVIGVYDRTKIKHLDSMVSHSRSATKNSSCGRDDC